MVSDFWRGFGSADFIPHGHCYLWKTDVVVVHLISDLLIALAYYSIPLMLVSFVRKRGDVPFQGIFWLFGAFIFWCGTTHLLNILTLWYPVYRIDGLAKAITACVSIVTACVLWRRIPDALALKGPRQLEGINRRLEAQIAENQRLQEDLERRVCARTAELTEAMQELESFSYSVSHDLRAPLRAIGAFSKVVLKDHGQRLDPEGQRYLGIIHRNVEQMGRLIDDLLAFSRLNRQSFAPQVVDANEIIDDILDEYGQLGLLPPPERWDFSKAPLPRVRADRSMMRQIFVNLLSNAIKFSSRKPTTRIEIGSFANGHEHIFFVRDDGAGFHMRDADKLFTVFQRLHGGDEFEGTGVGLAIVQKAASRHRGRVWAEGRPEQGATFYFSIPKEGSGFG